MQVSLTGPAAPPAKRRREGGAIMQKFFNAERAPADPVPDAALGDAAPPEDLSVSSASVLMRCNEIIRLVDEKFTPALARPEEKQLLSCVFYLVSANSHFSQYKVNKSAILHIFVMLQGDKYLVHDHMLNHCPLRLAPTASWLKLTNESTRKRRRAFLPRRKLKTNRTHSTWLHADFTAYV